MTKRQGGKKSHLNADSKPGDGGDESSSNWRSDPRFGHLATDPRYRSATQRKATRVEIDSRFEAMFTDPDFTTNARSDKRGRPVSMSSSRDLSRFYGLKKPADQVATKAETSEEEEKSEDNEVDDEDDESDEEGEEESSLEEADHSDDDEEKEDDKLNDVDEAPEEESASDDEEFRALEKSVAADFLSEDNAGDSIEPTSRVAITQQDWDQLKATDLYMLLCSRCPASQGRLLSVTVYPSQFGLQRMAAEAARGPLELVSSKKATTSAGSDSAAYHRSLRRHQMKRLWYFYAVAEFDSAQAAATVYEQCAGLEIESTGGCLRLSYVPEGMQFGGSDDVPDEWRHLVTRCSGIDPAAYKPSKFVTTSLGRTRVGITWDETPAERIRYLQGLFAKDEFNEADPDLKRLSEFLAMSSEEEDEGSEDDDSGSKAAAARRRALLLGSSDGGMGAPAEEENEGELFGGEELVATFSDDELPDDIFDAAMPSPPKAATAASEAPAESRKRSRRRRLKDQAKRARLTKAGLLPTSGDGGGSSDEDGDQDDAAAELPAGEQELAMLVADRSSLGGGSKGRVTASDVAADARFSALFSDPSYHVDPTHSEAAKVVEVQRLIISTKRRAATDN